MTLNGARHWDIPVLAPGAVSLFGGGKTVFVQGPAQPAPIRVTEYRDYLDARGYAPPLMGEMLEDLMLFEECFLTLARNDARDAIGRMSR